MRKVLVALCIVILLSGCSNKCEKQEIKECEPKVCDNELKFAKSDLEDVLVGYGKLIYENDIWLKEDLKVGTYYENIKDLYEVSNYDISMFIDNKCKLETTKIEFIVTSINPKVEYKFNPVLDCKFE